MNSSSASLKSLPFLTVLLILCSGILSAQPEVVDAVAYKQITHFETDQAIIAMKMSSDGSRIVFATGGPFVKVFTINTDGSGLTEVYDFQRTGTGPMIDISGDGEKVIWTEGGGAIFIANADGSGRDILADLIPNPDTNFADLEPVIPLPPRITSDGSQVYFINMDRDPRISGLWKVNSDNSGLSLVFNYMEVSSQVFGRDGTEYSFNTAFTDGFDISGDGSRAIFGTRIFKIEEGDLDRGHAIFAIGSEFYDIGEFAIGYQPFATDLDGDRIIMYRREFNQDLGYDEINVYFVPLITGDPVKVIGGLDIFGTSAFTQLAADGSRGITMGANGRLPITFVDRVTSFRLDLVSIDGISINIGNYRFSESRLPSINANGDRFCFLALSIPPQIWMASIESDGTTTQPQISGVLFSPNYVLKDGSSPAAIEAMVTDIDHPIHMVTFESFQNGHPFFRALGSASPNNGILVDDGTTGDQYADDGTYTNNTVNIDLPETPVGEYTMRITAVNNTLEEISMVDAASLSILEEGTSIKHSGAPGFALHPNFPNPFTDQTTITYEIPVGSDVEICVYNILGMKIATLLDGPQPAGKNFCRFYPEDLPGGIYYNTIRAGDFMQTRKMELIH